MTRPGIKPQYLGYQTDTHTVTPSAGTVMKRNKETLLCFVQRCDKFNELTFIAAIL